MTDPRIEPSVELILKWCAQTPPGKNVNRHLAAKAAQWGADQELEACCDWITKNGWFADPTYRLSQLLEGRRPKPPSLKQQCLKHLEVIERDQHYLPEIISDIRRALEVLSDD